MGLFPRLVGLSIRRLRARTWTVLLLVIVLVRGLVLQQFHGDEQQDVIRSREILRLTSAPHIPNQLSDVRPRGKPLQGAEIIRDAELLDNAPYKI